MVRLDGVRGGKSLKRANLLMFPADCNNSKKSFSVTLHSKRTRALSFQNFVGGAGADPISARRPLNSAARALWVGVGVGREELGGLDGYVCVCVLCVLCVLCVCVCVCVRVCVCVHAHFL